MYKCLVSGGCSFAYGFNLPDREKRYARIMADRMGVELIDVSAAGASNDFIATATVSGIMRALNKYDPKEIVVIVGWTSTERFEYFNKSIGRIMSSFVNPARHVNGNYTTKDLERGVFVNLELWDPSYGYYKLIHSFNYVYSLCKAYGIACVHKHNCNHASARFPNVTLLNTLVKNKDLQEASLSAEALECFSNWRGEISFQQFTMKGNLVIEPKYDTHPNEDGHLLWARKVLHKHKEFIQGLK